MNILLIESFIIVLSAGIVGVILFLLVERFKLIRRMQMPETEMGSIFSLTGTFFAMLVAFALIDVWADYDETASIVTAEAKSLVNIEQMSRSFSVPVRRQIQEVVSNYTSLVIAEEWPNMNRSLNTERTDSLLIELWHIYTDMSEAESAHPIYSQSLTNLSELGTNRRLRHLSIYEKAPPDHVDVTWLHCVNYGRIEFSVRNKKQKISCFHRKRYYRDGLASAIFNCNIRCRI